MEKTDALVFSLINNTRLRSKWLDSLMFTLTKLGEGWIILLLLTAIYFLSGAVGTWYVHSLVIFLAVGIICQIMKKHFPRARPVSVLMNVNVLGERLTVGSFPSGHTATAFALAAVFSSHLGNWAPLFFIVAALIGVTRVYVGAHFPLDVLCGAVIGLSTSYAVLGFLNAALSYYNPIAVMGGAIFLAALTLPLWRGGTIIGLIDALKNFPGPGGMAKETISLLHTLLKFALVGLSGIGINMAVYMYLTAPGIFISL